MDTAAYLTRQGWRGSGYSLHPSGHGIAKPLLISKKNDVLGVGNRKNDALASQWWLEAFDSTLKQVNVGAADGVSKPVERVTSTFQRSFYSNALYTNFVKGEGLSGTQTLATKPQTRMESNRQPDGLRNDGTVLKSDKKGRDNKRNTDSGGEGSQLVPTISSSWGGPLENEMTEDSQRKLKKIRKAGQVAALESSGEKGAAYLETRPLVDGVEEAPRLKRKIEDEPWETRKPQFSEENNLSTCENGLFDSDPPRKRRRGWKGLKEVSDVEASKSGGEKGSADAEMDSSDHGVPKDSRSKPKMEEKSEKTEGQERRQSVEISDDEMNILSKLEEQLSMGTTTGQEEQAQSANGQNQPKQLRKRRHQLTKQEIIALTRMRKKQRRLQTAKQSLEEDLKRLSEPEAASLSQVADDLSKDHGSASLEWNRVPKGPRNNRKLGDDAGQPNSSLSRMSRKQSRKNRYTSGQPTSYLPPMSRKQRKKNSILGDNTRQPDSNKPPRANHVSDGDKSVLPKKKTKRLSLRPSGKHVNDPAKTSRPLSGAENDVPGQGKPATQKLGRIRGRNEHIFEYDDDPVATPMDAIAQFLKSRAAK